MPSDTPTTPTSMNSNFRGNRISFLIIIFLVVSIVYISLFAPSSSTSTTTISSTSSSSETQANNNNNNNNIAGLMNSDDVNAINKKLETLKIRNRENLRPDNLMTIDVANPPSKKEGLHTASLRKNDGTAEEILKSVLGEKKQKKQQKQYQEQPPTAYADDETKIDNNAERFPTSTTTITKEPKEYNVTDDRHENLTSAKSKDTETQPEPETTNEVGVTEETTKMAATIEPLLTPSPPHSPSSSTDSTVVSDSDLINHANRFKSRITSRIEDQKDVLPEMHQEMKQRIKKGHEVIRNLLQPLPVLEDSKQYEDIKDTEIFSWVSSPTLQEASKNAKTEIQKDRVRFVRTVSSMLELFPKKKKDGGSGSATAAENDDSNNNTVNDASADEPSRTTFYSYARPFLRFKLNSDHSPSSSASSSSKQQESKGGRQTARMACLYAGFSRDFDMMLRTCTKSKTKCKAKRFRRMYGYQWERIVNPSNCDVFMSTWHLVGAGRYFTHDYDSSAIIKPTTHWMHRLNDQLAAIHVHHYDPYGALWKAAHRFPRKFPQIHPKQESKEDSRRRTLDQTRMFSTENAENKYMRLNDYSQSFKHYTAVLLTWSYETWGRGSYDVYLRLRTDERAVRQIMPSMSIVFRDYHHQDENTNNQVDSGSSNNNKMRTAVIELCPAAKYGRGQLPHHQQQNKEVESSNTNTNNNNNNNNEASGGAGIQAEQTGGGIGTALSTHNAENSGAKGGSIDTEKVTCDKHPLTAAMTLPHLPPEDPNSRADFEKTFFSVYKKEIASRQKVAINSFDIADFAYMGSPEIISYFGGHMWDLCTRKTVSPNGAPSFYPKLVNEFKNSGEFTFSEYNLMLWRMILEAGWGRDTMFYLVRISRASMPTTKSSVGNTKKEKEKGEN